MAYTLSWSDAEQTILLVLTTGHVTWEEYHAKYDDALKVVLSAGHRVDVVMDSEVSLPPGNPLPHFSKLISEWNEVKALGMIVVVSHTRMTGFIQATAGIASKVLNIPVTGRVIFVTSMEEALRKIYADRVAKDNFAGALITHG